MAIIKCPECGHQVSELAPTCPGCGVKIAGNLHRCVECGEVYLSNQTLCPACHCPSTAQQATRFQPTESSTSQTVDYQGVIGTEPQNSAPQQPPKKKSMALPVIIAIVILACVGVGAYLWNDKVSQNEQESYEYAMSSNDPLVLQQYLDKYRDENPEHRDSIQTRLSILQQADSEWNDAIVSGTRQAIEDYIKTHPNSPHEKEANDRIDSIDYCMAQKDKTYESYQKYLKLHPQGNYAEEVKNILQDMMATTVMPEEAKMVKNTFLHFFQAVNSHNGEGMINLVADQLTSFLGRTAAGKGDVLSFLEKLYKSDITNMNWHILNDYDINKREVNENEYEYEVTFSAEQNIDRTDPSQPKYQKYVITAVVSSEGKISEMNMKKVATK